MNKRNTDLKEIDNNYVLSISYRRIVLELVYSVYIPPEGSGVLRDAADDTGRPLVIAREHIPPKTSFVDTRPETTKLLMFLLRISARVCP